MIPAFPNVDLRLAPSAVSLSGRTDKVATNLVTLFSLDRWCTERPPLACRWYRDEDGRLACIWEADIV